MPRLVVMQGDGIGPEITVATLHVLAEANRRFGLRLTFEEHVVGLAALRAHGTTFPDSALAAARAADGVILGPVSHNEYPPVAERGLNLSGELRKRLDLYANIRPARTRAGLAGHCGRHVDFVIVCENTEGFYADRSMHLGIGEFMPTPDLALSVRKISREGSTRITEAAFRLARHRRRKVTAVHKANVLRVTEGLFLECVREVARQHPEVAYEEQIVDTMGGAVLVRDASVFDVIVTTNMFGDILSDEAAEIAGSLGLAASLNAGAAHAVAQAQHGSAPDIAGRDVANPASLIGSAAMLLAWLGERRQAPALLRAAGAIEQTLDAVIADPDSRTPDLGGRTGTKAFAEKVAEHVRGAAAAGNARRRRRRGLLVVPESRRRHLPPLRKSAISRCRSPQRASGHERGGKMSVTAEGNQYDIPPIMRAWVIDDPGQLRLTEKPVPQPGPAEVLVRVDAIAFCDGDIRIITRGPPALVEGGLPFNKNFTPGHEYVGTVVKLGPDVDEFSVGDKVVVEVHFGCGRCERCRSGMYTSCLNYGMNYGKHNKGHRANGFTTDGGFAEYAVNNVNTLVHMPDGLSDEEGTLIVTAGTAMYALDTLGGLIAGQSVAVTGPGPIGLLTVAVAKALGAQPVILTGTRDSRLELGRKLGADHVVNVNNEYPVEAVRRITRGRGVHYLVEASGHANGLNEAMDMVMRGGRICLVGFANEPVPVDVAKLVRNHIAVFGIRGEGRSATHRAAALVGQRRINAKLIHTHTFRMDEVPTAFRYSRDRIDGAIKVVVKMRDN